MARRRITHSASGLFRTPPSGDHEAPAAVQAVRGIVYHRTTEPAR